MLIVTTVLSAAWGVQLCALWWQRQMRGVDAREIQKGEDVCLQIAGSLHCRAETNTALQSSWIPIQMVTTVNFMLYILTLVKKISKIKGMGAQWYMYYIYFFRSEFIWFSWKFACELSWLPPKELAKQE